MPLTRRALGALALVSGLALGLSACSGTAEPAASGASTVTVSTNDGDAIVPVSPARVAVLDNTSFATVAALGITPVAVPKGLLPGSGFEEWEEDAGIADIGTHREPDLEALNAAEPDLIIGGYRFDDYRDDLAKIAQTIDIAPSDESEGGYLAGLRQQTTTLGSIFGKTPETEEIVAALDTAATEAASATTGQSVFLAVTTGGKIDNGASRIGRLLAPLDLRNVLAAADESDTAVHNDSGLAPETIAQLDPDLMIVLDRDAAVGSGGGDAPIPAATLIETNEALKNVTALTRGDVVYLAPDFYLDEGIQAYTAAFDQITATLGS